MNWASSPELKSHHAPIGCFNFQFIYGIEFENQQNLNLTNMYSEQVE